MGGSKPIPARLRQRGHMPSGRPRSRPRQIGDGRRPAHGTCSYPAGLMGKRGMLPKFRPATLGADAQPRPSIRPVRPSPPPPPPSPPRRMASGFSRAANDANDAVASNVAAFPGTYEPRERHAADVETPTVTGEVDQATLSRLAQTPETVPFEQATTHRRQRSDDAVFDDDTQARAVDHSLLDRLRRGTDGVHE